MKKSVGPMAKKKGLVVQALPTETLIYDAAHQNGYCLGRISAAVWRHCDGKNSIAAIATRVAAELDTKMTEKSVHLALEELSRASLLMTPYAAPATGFSRRAVLRGMGIAAAAAIGITIMVAPNKAHARSAGRAAE